MALPYLDLGDPAATPVLVLDGPGSRGLGRALEVLVSDPPARLIVPDRPDRSYTELVPELTALLDSLGVERAGVLGQSGGTPYALALAALAPERVRGVALIGPVAPLGERGALAEYGSQLRTGLRLARWAPWLLRAGLKRMGSKDSAEMAQDLVKNAPARDREVLERPELWAIHEQATAEVLAQPDTVLNELRRMARPWGFSPGDVRASVAIWVGDHDDRHPPAVSQRLARILGDAPVHVVADAATFGLAPAYPDAVRQAIG